MWQYRHTIGKDVCPLFLYCEFGTVLQLWVMRFSARYLRVARFFGGIMKRRFLFFIAMLIFALATFMGCSSNSDNSTNNNSFKYHKENIAVLSTVADSVVAEKMLSCLEDSCAIVNNTKLVVEDIIKHNDNCIELYADLMVCFYIQDGEVLLYTFETVYSDDTAILLYDSAQVNPVKILTETERNSLIYTQREYVVHTTIEITPASGFVLHNALGTSKVQLTFKNKSDTVISSVDVLMTPYISGVSFESKNASYSMFDRLTVNNSLTKTVIIPEWSNYDTYKILKVIVAFSDGTAIAFDSFDCQFLDTPVDETPSPDDDSTDTSDNNDNSSETPKPPVDDDSNNSTDSENDSNENTEEIPSSEGLKYSISSDQKSYYVSGYEGTSKIIQIPDTYNSLPVTSIGYGAFQNCTNIIGVIIPNNIIEIGYSAFYNCTNLEYLTIPNTLKSCKTYITSYCPKMKYNEYKGLSYLGNNENPYVLLVKVNDKTLNNYEIHENCKAFGNSVFSDCKNLESIVIPNGIECLEENLFNSCTNLKTVILPEGLKTVGGGTFGGCKQLSEITLPNSITSIGGSAFYECASLREINIPNNIYQINTLTFYKCISLKSIDLPYGIQSIGINAFSECKNLISINIPISIKEIGALAFLNCSNLTINFETSYIPTHFDKNWNYTNCSIATGVNNIETNPNFNYVLHDNKVFLTKYKGESSDATIPAYIEGYPVIFYKRVFESSIAENVVLEEGLNFIDDYAFYGCDTIKSVTIPNSIISIGSYAFYDCDGIETIEIPDSIEMIGNYAFYSCNSLETVDIGKGVLKIEPFTFANCNSLAEVVFSDELKEIGESAFENTAITNIELGAEIKTIGSKAFYWNHHLTNITIPQSIKYIGENAFYLYFANNTTINYLGNIEDWCRISFGNNAFPDFYNSQNNKNTLIIDGESIKDELTIPDTIVEIKDFSFQYWYWLKTVKIPEGVISIGEGAFNSCRNLETIKFEKNSKLSIIGKYAFFNCVGLSRIILPDNVEIIGESAFYGCNSLTSIVIGDSVSSIGFQAFDYCHKLMSIYYRGTQTDWKEINIEGINTPLISATRYYYIENQANMPTDGDNYWHYNSNGEIVIW